jgi:hypothetical protein
MRRQRREGRPGIWLAAGLVLFIFWLTLFDGFLAGVLATATFLVTAIGAYSAWIEK